MTVHIFSIQTHTLPSTKTKRLVNLERLERCCVGLFILFFIFYYYYNFQAGKSAVQAGDHPDPREQSCPAVLCHSGQW